MSSDRVQGTSTDSENVSTRERIDPFRNGISRRRMLRSSGAVGATAAVAGCLGDESDILETVFVFNTGDMTVSLIDAVDDELIRSEYLGTTSSWPSNQYASIERDIETLWMNVEGGVYGFDTSDSFEQVAEIETGSNANWQELSPDGKHLVISSREPVHTHYRVDADPSSDTFGEITAEIDRSEESDPAPAPCDITFGPDGEFSYCADRDADMLTVLRTDPFDIVAQLELEPLGDDDVGAFMDTASWDGEYVAIENFEQYEGDGTESIVDISDPENPEEIHRFTGEDGLTDGPMTSEWGPDSEILYVFGEQVTVIDVPDLSIIDTIDVGGGTTTGTWNPDRTKLYVPIQSNDEVAVIDHESRDHVTSIGVGSSPRGATARSTRPSENTQARFMAALSGVGITFGDEPTPTFCERECHCGRHC